jgi:glycosyltransferase involved in cell wall biosynthesis
MKILQVANGFPPVDRGGVENYTLELSQALRSLGHDVAVFCREPGDGRPVYSVRDDVTDGIPVRFVTNRFDCAAPLARRYFDRRIEGLFSRWVEEQQPGVLHFQHTHGLSASLLARAADMGLPFALTLWDYWYMCPQVNLLRPDDSLCEGSHQDVNCYECLYTAKLPPRGRHVPDFEGIGPEPMLAVSPEPIEHRPLGLSDAIYHPLQKALPWTIRHALLRTYDFARLKLGRGLSTLFAGIFPPNLAPLRTRARYMQETLSLCQHIIAPLPFVRAQYVRFGIPTERIAVIPPGMEMGDWAGFQPAPRPHGEALRFGYIGSLLRHKGVDFMVRAFRKLGAPNAELVLHGFELPDSPFTRSLHDLADGDPHIHFAGPYTKPELPGLLNQLDVLLIPSIWHETFSFVTREAVLAGLPVIASRMGGIPAAIDDGVNGLLLPPQDMQAWVAAMRRLVEDREWVAAFHRAQLSRTVKPMDEHAAELVQLYTRMQQEPS